MCHLCLYLCFNTLGMILSLLTITFKTSICSFTNFLFKCLQISIEYQSQLCVTHLIKSGMKMEWIQSQQKKQLGHKRRIQVYTQQCIDKTKATKIFARHKVKWRNNLLWKTYFIYLSAQSPRNKNLRELVEKFMISSYVSLG